MVVFSRRFKRVLVVCMFFLDDHTVFFLLLFFEGFLAVSFYLFSGVF